MTWKSPSDYDRNSDDHVERHAYDSLSITATGAMVSVKGNGTMDVDIPVIFVGQLHNLQSGTDAEVHVFGNGADTDLKMAIVTGPRDKHYKSNPGESWGQDPVDPNARVGYTPNGVRMAADAKSIAEWSMGMIEVDVANKHIYFRVPVISSQQITIAEPPSFKQ